MHMVRGQENYAWTPPMSMHVIFLHASCIAWARISACTHLAICRGEQLPREGDEGPEHALLCCYAHDNQSEGRQLMQLLAVLERGALTWLVLQGCVHDVRERFVPPVRACEEAVESKRVPQLLDAILDCRCGLVVQAALAAELVVVGRVRGLGSQSGTPREQVPPLSLKREGDACSDEALELSVEPDCLVGCRCRCAAVVSRGGGGRWLLGWAMQSRYCRHRRRRCCCCLLALVPSRGALSQAQCRCPRCKLDRSERGQQEAQCVAGAHGRAGCWL
jgi:hypothetical protein